MTAPPSRRGARGAGDGRGEAATDVTQRGPWVPRRTQDLPQPIDARLQLSRRASAETGYYGLPLLHRPVWSWEVPVYFVIGGAAGGAAVIGGAARRSHADPRLARDARWIAALGGAVSPLLLASDLGRPARFLMMLRVLKLQSPMSVGSWVLSVFSASAAAALLPDLAPHARPRRLVRALGIAGTSLSATTGPVLASYTGVLIGATSIPVWAASARVLPAHFAALGLATASSLLELRGHREQALDRIGLATSAFECLVGLDHEVRRREANRPLRRGRSGALVRIGGVLSGPLPLMLRLLGRRREAAISAVAGAFVSRVGWLRAGSRSAQDPGPPLDLLRATR